jgi:RNA polymerase sigma factor (TIGR02999 family)
MPDIDQTTGLLLELRRGNREAADRLLPLVYDELRVLAARYMHAERRDHTLQPTALVHEAYLRLVNERQVDWTGRSHFFAIAARCIRQILINHANAHRAAKRGGGSPHVPLPDDAGGPPGPDHWPEVDLLQLEQALIELDAMDERQARVVELRFFGGLNVEEAAQVLGVSPRTVKGDWRFARAWLRRRLDEEQP